MAPHDFYDVEDGMRRAERIKSRAGKSKHVKRMSYFSTALEHKYDYTQYITADDLVRITEKRYANPVISLYLTLTPDHLLGDPKRYMTVFNSLSHEAQRRHQAYFKTLSHHQHAVLKRDLEEMKEFLEEHFYRDEVKTLIIFKSDQELNLIVKLPVLLQDFLAIDVNPYTLPLQDILSSIKRYMVATVAKDHSTLYRYYMGILTEVETIQSRVTSDKVDLSRPNKVQRLRTSRMEAHFRKTADALSRHAMEQSSEAVLIAAEEHDTLQKFKQSLSGPLREKLVGSFVMDPQKNDMNAVKHAVESIAQQHDTQGDAHMEARLAEADAKGILVQGVAATIKAQNRFLVTDIYADSTFTREGYACPDHDYLSVEQHPCQICQQPLQQVENILDALMEIARRKNVKLHMASHESEFMNGYGHVAALTYVLPAPSPATSAAPAG